MGDWESVELLADGLATLARVEEHAARPVEQLGALRRRVATCRKIDRQDLAEALLDLGDAAERNGEHDAARAARSEAERVIERALSLVKVQRLAARLRATGWPGKSRMADRAS